MFCSNCGKPVAEGSKFCTNCGQSLQASSPASGSTPTGYEAAPAQPAIPAGTPGASPKKKKTVVALAVILPIVLIVIALAVWLVVRILPQTSGPAEPGLGRVNADSFPTVSVTLTCEDPSALSRGSFRVTENGVERTVVDFYTQGDSVTFSYLTDESGASGELRSFTYTVDQLDKTFTGQGSYSIPSFEPAQIQLVSTDVSDYPVVKAYFRVEDSAGQTVSGLDARSFIIQERVQGGAYLAREVRNVSALDRQGLNINLVADKSGSMVNDMDRTRQVMGEFIDSLDFGKGDQVEILAFDDIVQQMCCYTGDRALLANGINNMSPEGGTALYNALCDGIHYAALQGGARCVIAFTDGEDNVSARTPQDVVNDARINQVPVYIVGVGSGRSDLLRDLAEDTGGRYWPIDDLYDLGQIYSEIYAEQQELYMVEYLSDAQSDQYSYRDLNVAVSGEGCRGAAEVSFTPVRSLGNQVHTSRYELVKESMSWEQASLRCQEMGGHLATITSPAEEQQIIAMAEAQDVKYVWLGGYTAYDSYGGVFGQWVTGETFSYSNWTPGEPSRVDQDNTPERYIMLWYVRDQWAWNDQRNDPAAVVPSMAKSMGFVCEYES